jgi:hypothetical protein
MPDLIKTVRVHPQIVSLAGQRGQTIHLMDIKNIFITKDNVKIVIDDLLKNSKPGKQLGTIFFQPAVLRIVDIGTLRTLTAVVDAALVL